MPSKISASGSPPALINSQMELANVKRRRSGLLGHLAPFSDFPGEPSREPLGTTHAQHRPRIT